MRTHRQYYAVAVLFLLTETVHAQLTEILPGHVVDLDTVVVTPAQKWFVDSFLVALEIKEHDSLLAKYEKMPDQYFVSLNKRLQTQFTREELIDNEKQLLALAKRKLPIYRKAYELTLTASK